QTCALPICAAGLAGRAATAGVGRGDLPVNRRGAAAYAADPPVRTRPRGVRVGDREPAGALPLPAPVAVPVRAGARRHPHRGRDHDRLTAAGPGPACRTLLLVLTTTPLAPAERRLLRDEVLLVLGVSLAASAIWSLLRLVERMT